jgi:hypothetical protein
VKRVFALICLFCVLEVCAQRAKVVILMAEDCPVSLSQSVELNALENEFADRIDFSYLFPISSDNEAVTAFMHRAGLHGTWSIEGAFERAKDLKATTMPEALLFSHSGQLTYQGRIDNSFSKIGQRNRGKRIRDLQSAMQRTIDDPGAFLVRTQPVGCLLPLQKIEESNK